MTVPDPPALRCPNCGNTNTQIGASGNGMCFDCAHTWDPRAVIVPEPPVVEPFGMAPVEDVFGAEPAPADPPDPHAFESTWSGLADFRAAGGSMPNETWWREIMGAPADAIDPVEVVPADPPVEVSAVLQMAKLILLAGLEAAVIVREPGAALTPATGYLPDDPDLTPLIEQGAAVAVGMLLDAAGAEPEEVAAKLGIVLEITPTQNSNGVEPNG